MKKQQIVFIINNLIQGGVLSVLYEIVTHLDRKKFEIHIISFYEVDSPITFDSHIKVQYLFPKQKIYNSNSLLYKILKTIDVFIRLAITLIQFHPNAVLIPCMARPATTYTVLTQIFSNRYIIAFLHTAESEHIKYTYSSAARRWLEKAALQIAGMGSDQIIVNSRGIMMDLVHCFSISREKISIIPNPLNIDRINILKFGKSSFGHLVDNNKTVFVHVGRLSAEKNHRLLIQATARLKEIDDNFMVVCAGEGDQEFKIKQWIKEERLEKFIIMAGSLTNPFPLMAGAHALILTSHFESDSMVLKEAMVCDTPVISVDCPFGPKDILDNGKYGILVPPNNPRSLADAMYKIANDDLLAARLRKKGKQRAAEFDTKIIMRLWEKVLSTHPKE